MFHHLVVKTTYNEEQKFRVYLLLCPNLNMSVIRLRDHVTAHISYDKY